MFDIGALLNGIFTPGQGNPFSGGQGSFVDPGAVTPPPAVPPPAPPMLPPQVSPMADTVPPVNVGSALTGNVPIPQPRPANIGGVAGPAQGPGAPLNIVPPGAGTETPPPAAPQSNRLLETLRGVKMPQGPELQRVATPAAPRPTSQIKSGELLALLQAAGGPAAGGGVDYKLPSTLGMALAGRR